FIASNTRIRFITTGNPAAGEFFSFDDVQITDGSVTAGHWEVRVNMASTGTGDDAINALGIRGDDGDATSGGSELPVYADSMTTYGVNPPGSGTSTKSFTLYPLVSSGCSTSLNDFDYDSNSGTVGSFAYTSRSTAFTQSIASSSLSANNVWNRDSFSGWTSDTSGADYGIWTEAGSITSYLVGGTPNGNYTVLYQGAFGTTANDPTSNPWSTAFRLYLPTDAGGAPVKPYTEQLLAYSGCGGGNNGPNPLVVGQASCFTVTVRVVNPTVHAITFSASNLVTANIPGSGVVYNALSQISQGSIVSQPASGGTGNLTWNPGSVAAGATALLSYTVKVTPTSAGQRLPVTATPASGNGTRAVYVDETGNTTQTRSTFTFGPLCELAVTQGLLTQALVSSFRALPGAHGGVEVEWQTAGEVGTAGFRLYRRDAVTKRWHALHDGLLAGLQTAPQGGTYRFLDEGAQPGEPLVYRLEEVEVTGSRRPFGPFRVAAERDSAETGAEMDAAFERVAHSPARPPRRLAAAARALPTGPVATGRAEEERNSLWLGTEATGLYYLRAADLARWLGLTTEQAQKKIAEGKVTLRLGGTRPLPWYPDSTTAKAAGGVPGPPSAQGLFFYVAAQPTTYSALTAVRLDLGDSGPTMATAAVGPAASGPASYRDNLHVEVDSFAATVIGLDPDSDYWFWSFLQGNDPTYGHGSFGFDAPGAVAGATAATLTVNLQGATASGTTDEHRVAVSLNGTALGETSWTGITARSASFSIPAGVLKAGGNAIVLTATVGAGAPYSINYVDGFDLAYWRSYRASGESLAFTLPAAGGAELRGFTTAPVALLDVTAPLAPRWLSGATVAADAPSGSKLSFTSSAPGSFFAAGAAALRSPAAVRPWYRPLGSGAADLLVVAPAAWADAAERFANLRRAEGLTARVISIEQVADTFGGGIATPQALRSAVTALWAAGGGRLRYLVLAGDGSVDYRNLLGYGESFVPALFVKASNGGLFPADNRYGDVDGNHVPEIAVGRLPAQSAAELDAITSKLAGYGAGSVSWAGKVVMVADAADRGADFAADAERTAALASSAADVSVDRIYAGNSGFAAARGQLLADLAGGAGIVNYFGHGALDRLSAGGLLTSADANVLGNGNRLPLLTAMTCTVNRFALAGIPSLGELLVKAPSGGAAAVLAPSGIPSHGDSRALADRLFQQTGQRGQLRLGELLLRAYAKAKGDVGDAGTLDLYNLLGDPSMRLRPGVVPPPSGGGPPSRE
ncbi:MAG TPA: C25 family cysteine peptidase, partial [Thermoanaerobaculia bacterium]|nr:C25 family cysteine peptidase [Thermoanaerobaculia bacterium]